MNARQFNERNATPKPIILTKEDAQAALLREDSITVITLTAYGCKDGSVYVNCYPDCNCSQDSYPTFEKFWEDWGDRFSTEGKIE